MSNDRLGTVHWLIVSAHARRAGARPNNNFDEKEHRAWENKERSQMAISSRKAWPFLIDLRTNSIDRRPFTFDNDQPLPPSPILNFVCTLFAADIISGYRRQNLEYRIQDSIPSRVVRGCAACERESAPVWTFANYEMYNVVLFRHTIWWNNLQ